MSSPSKSITPTGLYSPHHQHQSNWTAPDYYNQYDSQPIPLRQPDEVNQLISPTTSVIRSSTYTQSLDSTKTWTDYVNQGSQPSSTKLNETKLSSNNKEMVMDHDDDHYNGRSSVNSYLSPGRQQHQHQHQQQQQHDEPDYSYEKKKEKSTLESNNQEIERLIKEIESSVNFDEALRGIQSSGLIESPHRFDEGEVNIHYKTPIQTLVKGEGHPLNIDDLSKFQKEMMRLHSTSDYDRNYNKESQRKHHFTPNQESIVHLDRYQKAYAQNGGSYSSQLLARVLFNFHALSSREISVRKGDIVIIHRPVNHHWVEVEDSQSGLKGLVPRSYLDYEQEGIAKAKYDFDAKTSVEISFKKGDVLKLIRKVDENWYEGINQKGVMGIFPCSYVETLKTPLYLQLNRHLNNQCNNNNQPYVSRPNCIPIRGDPISSSSHHQHHHHPAHSQHSHHHHHHQHHLNHRHQDDHSPPRPISPQLEGFNGISSPPPTASTGSGITLTPRDLSNHNRRREMLNELSSIGTNGIKSKLYRVIYPYKPRQVDELELFSGDLLAVSMHCDDGWFVGYSALTGNYGTFPGNYVEPLI